MTEIYFRDNHNDVSTPNGFQFEFYCERCHDTWRSPFDRYTAGTFENVLGAADSLLGGLFGSARNAVGQVAGAGYSKAKDAALQSAAKQAANHFHRCPRCSNHFCDNCWNGDEGVCVGCIPRLDAELAEIQREAKLMKAREAALAAATVSEEDLATHVLSCRDCGAAVGRAKFCPECGKPVSLTRTCPKCSADVPVSSKFCPECGAKS